MTLPLVGRVDALQDAHQRRLARAVAADDGVNRAGRDSEIDPVVGDDRTECRASLYGRRVRVATRALSII